MGENEFTYFHEGISKHPKRSRGRQDNMECNGISQKNPDVNSNKIQDSAEDFTEHMNVQSNTR